MDIDIDNVDTRDTHDTQIAQFNQQVREFIQQIREEHENAFDPHAFYDEYCVMAKTRRRELGEMRLAKCSIEEIHKIHYEIIDAEQKMELYKNMMRNSKKRSSI